MNELVSVVITTYKREPAIVKRALDSVINQTYRPLEIIVVDDSPQDYEFRDTVKKLVQTFDEDIYYVQHESNKGACVARNTGLKLACGKYIAFLDDDDEWVKEKIEKQILVFKNNHVALVYCQIRVLNDKTGKTKVRHEKFYDGYVYPQLMLKNFIGSTSFPLIQKESLENIGGFDPAMEASQDYDVWLRLSKRYKISFIKEPLGIYHWHEGDQITKDPKKKINGIKQINEKNIDYLISHRHVWWRRIMLLAPFYAKDLQLGKALNIWKNSVIHCPFRIVLNTEYLLRIVKGYSEAYKNKKNNVKQ